MPSYKVRALAPNNTIIDTEIKANTPEEARQLIVDKGGTLIRLDEAKGIRNFNINLYQRLQVQDIIVFCRELAIIIRSGISLTVGLDILKKQSVKSLKENVQFISAEVQKGRTLAQAMKEGNLKFPELLVRMISTGEASGNLDNVLENMADYYERESYIIQKVRSAMIYPVILTLVCIALLVLFSSYILPEMKGLLGDKLPPITKFTMAMMSAFVSWYSLAFITILVTTLLLIRRFMPEKRFRYIKDSIILRAPIFGKVIKNIVSIRFTKTLHLLLKSGMDIVNILDILRKIMSNSVAEESIDYALDGIKRGERLGMLLNVNRFFDPLIVQMINVGEETGELERMLEEVSKFYEKKLERQIEKLISMVEPVFTLVIGVMIGFIIISVAYPIMNMAGSMNIGSGLE